MEGGQQGCSLGEGVENVLHTPAYPGVTPDSNCILRCLDQTEGWGGTRGLTQGQYPSSDPVPGHGGSSRQPGDRPGPQRPRNRQ